MNLLRYRAWVLIALTLLFVAAVRFRLRDMPLERDEGEYAYAGQLVLQGVPPYKEAYNMKLPGTYAAYALIMALFGQSPAGIHFGILLVNAGAIILMFFLGRALLDETAGVAAAVSFALLSLSPAVFGLAGHATHFVVLPALGGILLLIKGVRGASSVRYQMPGAEGGERQPAIVDWPLFFSGLLFGLAFLMKQHGIFFGLFGLLYLLWTDLATYRDLRDEQRTGRWPGRRSAGGARRTGRAATGTANDPTAASPPAAACPPPTEPSMASHPPRLSHFAAAKLRKAAGESQPQIEQTPQESHPPASLSASAPAEAQPTPTDATADDTVASVRARHLWLQCGVFALGFALPYLGTCLILWLAGVFPQFAFWTLSYARRYVSQYALVDGPALLRLALRAAVGPNVLLWLLPWAGALVMWWEERLAATSESRGQKPDAGRPRVPRREAPRPASAMVGQSTIPASRFFLTALLFCSFASVAVGLHFREHYFITLLPALSLLTAVAVSRALYLVKYDRTIELFLAVAILLGSVGAAGWALIGNGAVWFALSPAEAVRETYSTTLFSETVRAAAFIKDNAAANARIAVLGSEPEIYFYAHRRSATGYIYMYPLTETHEFAINMQQGMIAEIERARPEYVVYINDRLSWLDRPGTDRRRVDDWWEKYWPANFEMVRTVEIQGKEMTDQGQTTEPGQEQKFLFLLKRKG